MKYAALQKYVFKFRLFRIKKIHVAKNVKSQFKKVNIIIQR